MGKWDYNDYYREVSEDESYGEYVERKKAEQASTDLAVMLFLFLFRVIRAIFVYFPLFYISYTVTVKYRVDAHSFGGLALIFLLVYIQLGVIYFVKGILIGLKSNGNSLWILLWIVCVLAACAIPGLIVQSLIQGMFGPSAQMLPHNQFISWGIGGLFSLYVYSCYKFRTHYSPRFVFWPYWCGFKLVSR